jgi:phage shock protein C
MSAASGPGPRRLYRSITDRKLAGVCGGLAEYLGIDPVIARLVWVAVTIVSFGFGILLYIIAILVVPNNPHQGGPRPA